MLLPMATSYTYDESAITKECAVKRKCSRSLLDGVRVGNRGAVALRVSLKRVRTTFSTVVLARQREVELRSTSKTYLASIEG